MFSTFDPRTYIINLYLIVGIVVILNSNKRVLILSRNSCKIWYLLLIGLVKELMNNTIYIKKRVSLFFVSVISSIFIFNLLGLYPQVSSVTSHLFYTLPVSFIFWRISLIFFCRIVSKLFYHLIPNGTPIYLSTFMIMIEITRIMIRPLTLCIRITANLVAGHVLITLLGDLTVSLDICPSLILTGVFLTILELFVSFIQAYVFLTLTRLYLSELK